MTDKELIEQLADKEHASWAHWMKWVFKVCERGDDNSNYAGQYIIPAALAERWQRQIATPYSDLSEKEKDSDRAEVKLIMPIIKQWAKERTA